MNRRRFIQGLLSIPFIGYVASKTKLYLFGESSIETYGTAFFVNSDAEEFGDGLTPTTPLKTLAEAQSKVRAGRYDRIYINTDNPIRLG